MVDNDFSAKEPSLGYLYQLYYALLIIMQSESSESFLQIECLDDIDLTYNTNKMLFQAKYHKKNDTNLTDRSKDFWRTIRIWGSHIIEDKVDLQNTEFILLTTSEISNNSILLDIKTQNNIDNIISVLYEISKEKNKENQKGYNIFQKLNDNQRKELISRIKIADSALNFKAVEMKIKKLLRYSTNPQNLSPLFERLTGWWQKQCILILLNEKESIKNIEVEEKIWFLNDQLKNDNLPIDFEEHIEFKDTELKKNDNLNYIKQLSLISISDRHKKFAMSDYYRAFAQRSNWLREKLLNPQEEIKYEKKLREYWERFFLLLEEDTRLKSKAEKEKFGKNFYLDYFYKNPPSIYIRERCTDLFIILGSYHILSDDLKIGWHPNYKELLDEDNNA